MSTTTEVQSLNGNGEPPLAETRTEDLKLESGKETSSEVIEDTINTVHLTSAKPPSGLGAGRAREVKPPSEESSFEIINAATTPAPVVSEILPLESGKESEVKPPGEEVESKPIPAPPVPVAEDEVSPSPDPATIAESKKNQESTKLLATEPSDITTNSNIQTQEISTSEQNFAEMEALGDVAIDEPIENSGKPTTATAAPVEEILPVTLQQIEANDRATEIDAAPPIVANSHIETAEPANVESKIEAPLESPVLQSTTLEEVPAKDPSIKAAVEAHADRAGDVKVVAPLEESSLPEPKTPPHTVVKETSKEALPETIQDATLSATSHIEPAEPMTLSPPVESPVPEAETVENAPAKPVPEAKKVVTSTPIDDKATSEPSKSESKSPKKAASKEIVLEIKKEIVVPVVEEKKASQILESTGTKSTTVVTTKIKETSEPELKTKEKTVTVTQKSDTEASVVVPCGEDPQTLATTSAKSTITKTKETCTPDSKTTEKSVTVATEATSKIKKDHEEPSLLVKAEHVVGYIGEEIVNGAGDVITSVKNNPELIAEGALSVVVGAASLVQPELLPGEATILAKMAMDAAKKGGLSIAQDEAKKVAHAIAKDISEDEDLDGIKDELEKAKDGEAESTTPDLAKDDTTKVEDVSAGNSVTEDTLKTAEAKPDTRKVATNGTPKDEATAELKQSSPSTPESTGDHTISIQLAQAKQDAPNGVTDTKPEASEPAPVSLKITIGTDGEVKSVTQSIPEVSPKATTGDGESSKIVDPKSESETKSIIVAKVPVEETKATVEDKVKVTEPIIVEGESSKIGQPQTEQESTPVVSAENVSTPKPLPVLEKDIKNEDPSPEPVPHSAVPEISSPVDSSTLQEHSVNAEREQTPASVPETPSTIPPEEKKLNVKDSKTAETGTVPEQFPTTDIASDASKSVENIVDIPSKETSIPKESESSEIVEHKSEELANEEVTVSEAPIEKAPSSDTTATEVKEETPAQEATAPASEDVPSITPVPVVQPSVPTATEGSTSFEHKSANEQMVTVSKESLDHLHHKLDSMHETLQQITKTLALRLPPAVPVAPQETLVDAHPEIIPGSPPHEQEHVVVATGPATEFSVEVEAAPSNEPIEESGAPVPQESVAGESDNTITPVVEAPKKPTHKKRGSVFSFLWPFGGSTAPAEPASKPTVTPAEQPEAAASTQSLEEATTGASVAELGAGVQLGA